LPPGAARRFTGVRAVSRQFSIHAHPNEGRSRRSGELRGALERIGAEVDCVSSIGAARLLILGHTPGLLVSEAQLREGAGAELIADVRGLAPDGGRKVVAVALTGGGADALAEALAAGFDACPSKSDLPDSAVGRLKGLVRAIRAVGSGELRRRRTRGDARVRLRACARPRLARAARPGMYGALQTAAVSYQYPSWTFPTDVRARPPARGGRAPAPNQGTPMTTRLDGVRVLFVDDDRDQVELYEFGLGLFGAKVTAAASAPEALEAVSRTQVDVVVSDIELPGEDGYELARALAELPPERGGGVPALALTGYARAEDRARALEAGFAEHCPKPCPPSELAATIARVVAAAATTRRLCGELQEKAEVHATLLRDQRALLAHSRDLCRESARLVEQGRLRRGGAGEDPAD
jgi:CheY-like chemotaxis protein